MKESAIKVLLIEDNPADARLVVERLKGWPARTVATSNAPRLDAALAMLERERFDLVLLDLNLPDSVGIGGLAAIVARDSRIPVIVLTGQGDEETGIEALNKGATDYLVKGETDEHVLRRSIRYAVERKRIEETLRESEQNLRRSTTLLEAVTRGAKVIIAVVDPDYRYTYMNSSYMEEMKRLTGKEVAVGTRMHDAFADMPEQLALALDEWKDPLGGLTTNRTIELGETGRYRRIYDVLHTPIRDAAGRIVGAGEVGYDVTERKLAEDSLKIERRKLAAVIESTPVGIVVTDAKGGVLNFNAAFEEIWGTPVPPTHGVEDYVKYEGRWVDTDAPVAPEEWASAIATRTGRPCLNQILRIRRFDGTYAYVQNGAAPVFGAEGEIVGSVVAILDITERMEAEQALRESERRWRELADAMPQMVWTADRNGRCDFLNRRWREYAGTAEEELLDFGWVERIHPDDRERMWAAWTKAADEGTDFSEELRILGHGDYRWHKTSAVPVPDERGGIAKWYGTNTDIEEIKQAELRLGRANERLELLVAVAGRLLAARDPQRIVVEIATMTMDLLGCDVFFNYLVDRETRRLRLNAAAGEPVSKRSSLEWLDFEDTICGAVAREGHRIVAERIQEGADPRAALVKSLGIGAYACHPLLAGDRVVGTLSFGARGRDRFSADDLALMKAVSDHIAIAIERLWADETLREKEHDLKRAQAVSRTGSWRFNLRRGELAWSEENRRIFGVPEGTAASTDLFFSLIHPDDRADVQEAWAAVMRGEPYDIEHRIVSNGEVRWVREIAEPEHGPTGDLVGAFGTAQDITESKRAADEIERSRRWLARVAETTPDIIFVLDVVNNRHVYANRRLMDLLGYSAVELRSIDDILEKTIETEDLSRVAAFYRDIADTRAGEIRVLTYRARHKDGRVIWLENRVTPFSWDDRGMLVEVIGISHDVTDLKRAHEVLERDRETFERLVDQRTAELLEAHREIEQSRRLSDIGMLASTVAHELRNPLGVIRTALYNLERKKQGTALDKHLQTIGKKVDESNQIINNLLMYARIKQPSFERVRIRTLLHDAVESVKTRADSRSVTFREESGPVEDVEATIDPVQISEVIGNILTNAVQSIPPERTGAVTLSAQTADGLLLLRVRDTGIGIDPEALPRVFEPFYTSKSKGTGLGLSLCRELVSLHNGSIDIESEPGRGTIVTVAIPLSPGARRAAAVG